MRFIFILAAVVLVSRCTESHESEENEVEGPIKEMLAQSGGIAKLPCKLSNPVAGTITWVRRKDRHILTVGTSTYTLDKRFMVKHDNADWTLLIHRVTFEDVGVYECIITSYPIQQYYVRLHVTEAYSEILGAPDFFVRQGSKLQLSCRLIATTEQPVYVFWYRQERMINYDSEPGLKVEFNQNGSMLTVENTKYGVYNYTCVPSNAKPSYIVVHVIEEEEKPEAMQGGYRRNVRPAILSSKFLVYLLVTCTCRIPTFITLNPT